LSIELPAHIARYEIRERIGSGAMGVVHVAHDPELDREIALKVIRLGPQGSTRARTRLAREARAMAKLSHPNVVQVYDAGVFDADGTPRIYIAMELVDGQDLRHWMRSLRETERWKSGACWEEIVEVFLEAGRGLIVAHEAGLVHRDFKPANVLVDREGHARVGDFGLARPVDEREAEKMLESLRTSSMPEDLTLTRGVVGTPGYMGPELLRGQPASPASDQYAFCVSLHEALHGVRPIETETYAALALATLEGTIQEPPETPKVPPRLRAVVLRGLRSDPGDRFESMDALLDALEEVRARPARRRRLGIAAGALAVLAVAAYGIGRASIAAPDPCAGAGASVSEAWSDAEARRLQGVLRAGDASYAETAAIETRARLDAYANDLRRAYRDACVAADSGQSETLSDRRSACLEQRRGALAMLVDELASGGALEHAARAAHELPSLAPCEDLEVLSSPRPPPPDEAAANRAEEVRSRVAELDTKLRAGRYEEAAALAADLPDAEWGPIVLDVTLARARVALSLGRWREAYEASVAAARAALGARDADGFTLAATTLVDVAGVRLSRPAEGEVWAELAQGSVADRERRDLRVPLLVARARLESALGRREAALELAAEAVAMAEDEGGLALVAPLSAAADIRGKMRDYVGAVPTAERLDELLRERLGTQHPERIAARVRLAGVLHGAQRRGDARQVIEAAREDALTLPEDHPTRARALTRYADILAQGGEPERALEEYDVALEATRASYGEEHTEVARVLLNRAGSYARLGRIDEAIAEWRRALELRVRLLGEGHPDLAIILQNIGSVEVERGNAAAALGDLARAHDIRHESPASAQARADVDYWYGRALYESGEDREQGREMVAAAAEVSEEGGYTNPAEEMRRWLATHP